MHHVLSMDTTNFTKHPGSDTGSACRCGALSLATWLAEPALRAADRLGSRGGAPRSQSPSGSGAEGAKTHMARLGGYPRSGC